MRFSTKSRYGLRLVARLAREGCDERPMALWKLAEKEHISKKYVEHIVAQLERAGIVQGFRGPGGGYCLVRKPKEISVREVIEAVENLYPNVCVESEDLCLYTPYNKECVARPFWTKLYEVMTDTSRVNPEVERRIEVEGEDLESLLYNWLEEFIYLTDSEGLIFSVVNVEEIRRENGRYRLAATARGERFNPEKHVSKTDVKAATYHEMEINVGEDEARLVFVLDI